MLANKQLLEDKKNLLAFSAGVDSTALFFLLLEHNISFDIAIVDYGTREQSKEEVAYAKELAKIHNLTCFLHQAPKIKHNFEATARDIRYTFFEELIKKHHYDNLLTAHHLGDRLEWMLMQFCKGAGCVELSGMQSIAARDGYTLIRPLLAYDKSDLLAYLTRGGHRYFQDASNTDERYLRNTFRKEFATPLLERYKEGIRRSFAYIDKDRELLESNITPSLHGEFAYFKTISPRVDMRVIDKYFKSLGHLITSHEKELLLHESCVVIGREFVVARHKEFVFIAPYLQTTMPKAFKEKMRKLGIEPKLRGYLSHNDDVVELIVSLCC